MYNDRPATITTAGVLNIVFGSLGFICFCLGSIGLIALYNPNPLVRDALNVLRNIPGYMAVTTIDVFLSMILASLTLTSGIGLLYMANWARVIALICGFVNIGTTLAMVMYTLAVVNPRLAHIRGFDVFGFFDNTLITVAYGFLKILFSIIVIVLLLLPSVGEVIGKQHRYPTRYEEDDQDRPDYGRRRYRDEEDDPDRPDYRRRRYRDEEDW